MRHGVDCNGREWEETSLYGKMIDISNQQFCKLTALFPVKNNGKIKWLCKCDCGNEVVVQPAYLKNKNTRSCGCLQKKTVEDRWIEYRKERNVVGKKFSRLTALEFVGIENQESMYSFLCDCGNVVIKSLHSVSSGNTSSCGCLFTELLDKKKYDIIGQKFGKLTVLSYAGINQYGATNFECLCDCGNTKIISRNSLIMGTVKTCGCVRSIGETNIKCILDNFNIKYKPQQAFSDLISEAGGHPTYDFSILNHSNDVIRLIEFDGRQHEKPYEYFGGEEKFRKTQKNDKLKNQYAISHNIPLVRIPYSKRDNMTYDDLFGDRYLVKGDI